MFCKTFLTLCENETTSIDGIDAIVSSYTHTYLLVKL